MILASSAICDLISFIAWKAGYVTIDFFLFELFCNIEE
jgi:hypothetical protein